MKRSVRILWRVFIGGLDVYWKNVGFSMSALYACYEEENNSGLKSRLRLMFGVNVYFDQSRFVF